MKALFLATAVAVIFLAQVQAAPPRIGYVYPAGGQRGTSFEVVVGGQYLDDPTGVYVSGEGVSAEILEHNKLPSAQVISDFRDKLREIQPSFREPRGGEKRSADEMRSMIVDQLSTVELTEKNLRQIEEYERRRNDPKQQLNTQIGENVRVRVTVAADATPGIRYWRLETDSGLSNPMRFAVGELPEIFEPEPWRFDLFRFLNLSAPTGREESDESLGQRSLNLPTTVNGRILPGEVDEFSFEAREGEQVVVSLQARNLIPYLADAVPGWFQAVVSLHDTRGRELAFADDYRFDPDPVMFYKIPRDGEFRIRVHDSIYRGREDFVYRISIGELPFLTAISPLGGAAGSEVDLVFHGGNLDEHHQKRYPIPETPGIIGLFATTEVGRSNSISFHADSVPEDTEREENGRIGVANELKPPGIINGTIGRPGDVDFFRVKGTGNQPMTFEIFARRLGSPVDAGLTIFDDDGKQIGFNDDFENPAAGLTTHHADSRITLKLPSDGQCFVRVSDIQNQGGYANAYRLKVTQGIPDFALRVTPSTLNAKPGATVRLTVHALRLDGFDGAITMRLKDPPAGFELKSVTIPAGEERVDLSLEVPSSESEGPVTLALQGTADVDGHEIVVDVVPAEDMMQAFIYRHLVPVDELMVEVRTPPEKPAP